MAEKTVTVSMSDREMREACQPIIDTLNAIQKNGLHIDRAIMALLYVAGGAIRQRGGKLLINLPLREALPPLVQGYNDSLGIGHSRVHDDHDTH